MQLLRTSFNLRSDLRWSQDVYVSCVYAWINGVKNLNTGRKNYEQLLKKLPRSIDFTKNPDGVFSYAGETLEYESFTFDGHDYLGFLFTYRDLDRIWKTRIAFKRTDKHVRCFVSLDCDLARGARLPSISKPKILDYLIQFQDGDGTLDISEKPHIIDYYDIGKAKSALIGKLGNFLPIVYLSCSERTHSLKPSELAKQLLGVAHVLAEKDKTIYDRLKLDMGDAVFPKGGEISICYVGQPLDIFNRYSVVDWEQDPRTLVQDIFLKILRKNLSLKFNFSWDEFLEAQSKFRVEEAEKKRIAKIVETEELREELIASRETRNEQSRQIRELKQQLEKAIKDRDQYKEEHIKYDSLNKIYRNCLEERNTWEALANESDEKMRKAQQDLEVVKQELHDAKVVKDALQSRFDSAWSKNVRYLPLAMPNDPQMFPDEYKCQLVSLLRLAYKNLRETDISPKIRSKVIVEKILEANKEAVEIYEDYNRKKSELEAVAQQQNLKTGDGAKVMKPFCMEFAKKKNNHGKIRFAKDENESYLGSEVSTGSDLHRGGKNQAKDLMKAMLWSE